MEPLSHHTKFCDWRKQRREDYRQDSRRHHEHQAVRYRDQPAFQQNVCLALSVIRAYQLVLESEFTTKIHGPGLLCEEGIRTSLDYASIDVLGGDYTAEARAGFVKNILQRHSRAATLLERERSGEPGNTAAEDGNAFHVVTERAGESGPPNASPPALQPCQPFACKICQCRNQQWRIVQRLGTPEPHAFFFRKLPEADINVVQNLNVVAQESDWLNKNSAIARLLQFQNRIFDRGAKPRAAGHSLALKGEPPRIRRKRHLSDDQSRSLSRLLFVRIAFCDSSLRNAMRRKDHGEFGAQFARGVFPSSPEFLCESLDEKRVVMPGVDKFKPERQPIAQRSPVQAYTGPRILRSKADHDRS